MLKDFAKLLLNSRKNVWYVRGFKGLLQLFEALAKTYMKDFVL